MLCICVEDLSEEYFGPDEKQKLLDFFKEQGKPAIIRPGPDNCNIFLQLFLEHFQTIIAQLFLERSEKNDYFVQLFCNYYTFLYKFVSISPFYDTY